MVVHGAMGIAKSEVIKMVQRPVCLCDGKLIGIESIFTIDSIGRQINIEEKVEALRKKSRSNELFCPCGCGANLILVAGDRGVVQQHFRLRSSSQEKECQYVSEGATSVFSKIVLKCWLEEKLRGANIESRVPICAVDDTDRKYEMTLLARDRKIAVSYCHDRANLSDEKLDILDANSGDIVLHYIVDIENTGNRIQYPEMMMKVQQRQGYCLFLRLAQAELLQANYHDAELRAFYCCRENGCWNEIEIISDHLSTFSFGTAGELLYKGKALTALRQERQQARLLEQERERLEREKKAEELAARQKRQQEEQEQKQAEWLEKQRQAEADRALALEEQQKRMAKQKAGWQEWAQQQESHYVEQRQLSFEKQQKGIAEQAAKEAMRAKVAAVIDQDPDTPFYDSRGDRWVRCIRCGKVDTEDNFTSYGGIHTANLGECRECTRKAAANQKESGSTMGPSGLHQPLRLPDAAICPQCGGKLVRRAGRYGLFMGCQNYPKCRYTRNIVED